MANRKVLSTVCLPTNKISTYFRSKLLVIVFLITCGTIINNIYTNSTSTISTTPPDLSNFKIVTNNHLCLGATSSKPLKAVIIVPSHIGNFRSRNILRHAYPAKQLRSMGVRLVFVLGTLENDMEYDSNKKSVTQSDIFAEQKKNYDIVQFSLTESYRNLTFKMLLGLQWVLDHCSRAEFIIKMDDDFLIDLHQLLNLLESFENSVDAIIGKKMIGAKPVRVPMSKYFVSYQEYPEPVWPVFTSGGTYILPVKTASVLLKTSRDESYLFLEDVYITGLLAQRAGIGHVDISDMFSALNIWFGDLKCCTKDNGRVRFECVYAIGPMYKDNEKIRRAKNHMDYCTQHNNCSRLHQNYVIDNLHCV